VFGGFKVSSGNRGCLRRVMLTLFIFVASPTYGGSMLKIMVIVSGN